MPIDPINPIVAIDPIPPPPVPTRDASVSAVSGGDFTPLTKRRRFKPSADRTGTLVSSMEINLDSGRIALLSPEGSPICGDVSTDLAEGSYMLRPDFQNKKWIFDSNQVKSGLRFYVVLDGVKDPFDLVYVSAFVLTVSRGITPSGAYSLEKLRDQILDAVHDRIWVDSFILLGVLNSIDLYDVVEDIYFDNPGVIGDLLLHFEEGWKSQILDMTRILIALESVAADPKKLFVDAFDRYRIEPKSFKRDKARETSGSSNVMIRFEYYLNPARAIIVYADDIKGTNVIDQNKPQYGEGCLLYPNYFTGGNTPRMLEAKKKCIAEIEAGNLGFISTSAGAVMTIVIDLVFTASALLNSTYTLVRSPRGVVRPVSQKFAEQPGKWLHDFEGGANMSEEAAAYEARVCHKDKGIGYYINGVQFDGFERDVLIDAKYYPEKSGMTKTLLKNNYFVGNRLVAQAYRQIRAAGGRQIEWRVASQPAAGKIQELFQMNRIPVRVVFVP